MYYMKIPIRLNIYYQENKIKIINLIKNPEKRTKEKLTEILNIFLDDTDGIDDILGV